MRRSAAGALFVVGGLVVAACGTGAKHAAADDPSLVGRAIAPVVAHAAPARGPVTAAPTTVHRPVPTTVALPVPSAPPLDRGLPGPQVGAIKIPKIGLDLPLFSGINTATLDEGGAGLWPGTAVPGRLGNAVVAAHRVSHGAPFRHIDELVVGDQVQFTVGAVTTTYVVTGTGIVTPDMIQIIDQTADYTATLFACHPPGSTKYRYVVKLKLASAPA